MIDDLNPFPSMKDSGVPWLGEVPMAWDVVRCRHLFEIRKRIAGVLGFPVLSVTQQGLRPRDIRSGEGQLSQDYSKYQLVKPGEFAMNAMDLLTGGVGLANCVGVTSPDYRVFGLRDATNKRTFFLYLLRLLYTNHAFYAHGQGSAQLGRWRLPRKRFNEFLFPVPPIEEQAAIVRFLDHADRKIRRYIYAKQKLIKLLEEQKQAIIHRAVTRGLNPNVPLKASGVEWPEDLPEHWEVARASSVCSFISAKAHEQFVEPDGEHICVTARFVSTDGRSFRRCTANLSPARRGDVLMVMSDLPRGRALARSFLVKDDQSYAVNQRVCILRPIKVHPAFLAFATNRHPELLAHDDGFNQTHLPNSAFKIMRLPLPPHDEQVLIADHLICETAVLEDARSRAALEIELLGEYRTRLIADVVTGKLDVREAAAQLLETDQELSPFEEFDEVGDLDEDDPDGHDQGSEDPKQ